MPGKQNKPDYLPLGFLLSSRLSLTSFQRKVTESSPKTVAMPAKSYLRDARLQSGDAFSISYLLADPDAISAVQSSSPRSSS
jgi:hypothetical protein